MGGLYGLILLAAVGAAATDAPTKGETYRLIYTDRDAFDAADKNRDGQVSEVEFEEFHANRGGYARGRATRTNIPQADGNEDGAFTPDELYDEARRTDRDNGRDGRRRNGTDYGDPYDE